MKSNKKKLGLVAGATLGLGVAGIIGASNVQAKGFSVLGSAGQVRSTLIAGESVVVDGNFAANASSSTSSKAAGEGKCGEGKCGENKDHKKGGDGKSGESKAAGDKKVAKDHKTGGEGKCGEGKCG